MKSKTKKPQYQRCLDVTEKKLTTLGLMTNQAWHDDPRHLLFTLPRSKFVAKMQSTTASACWKSAAVCRRGRAGALQHEVHEAQ